MKNKVLYIIAAILILVIIAVAVLYMVFSGDSNELLKRFSKPVKADVVMDIEFDYDQPLFKLKRVSNLAFTPEESKEYTLAVSDISLEKSKIMSVHVMDENLTEYLRLSNEPEEDEEAEPAKEMEGSVFLQKSQQYYIIFDVFYADTDDDHINNAGSFTFSLSGSQKEKETAVLEEGETVILNVGYESQSCAIFRPSETGYYSFDPDIISKDAASGFATVSSVTADDKTAVTVMDGTCYLEAGKEYCIWVSANETARETSEVRLSCSKFDSESMSEPGSIKISGNLVIDYSSANDEQIVIYSESEGDPKASLYDSDGFPLRSDDNSGGTLSGNEKDFAIVFSASSGKKYRICIENGDSECTVRIVRYTGDGSSLTKDDIELPE